MENIVKEIPKSYALSASLSATTFYEWVSNILHYFICMNWQFSVTMKAASRNR